MTARKTTPHLKRGPKPKPKPPKRPRGRAQARLRDHPDRYLVARYDIATMWRADDWTVGALRRAGRVRGTDLLRRGESLAEVRKEGDRLRVLARRYCKLDDLKWRAAIKYAISLILCGAAAGSEAFAAEVAAASPERFAFKSMAAAVSVGEAAWARRELLPLLAIPEDSSVNLLDAIIYIGFVSDIEQVTGPIGLRKAYALRKTLRFSFPA